MKMDEYSTRARATLTDEYRYGEVSAQMMGVVLGLGGEAGEVQEKFKKILRDKQGIISEADSQEIAKELGDVLWYVSVLADMIGTNLAAVAAANNKKLADRQARQQLQGSGDNR